MKSALLFVLTMIFSSAGQAIFIRGNGGFGVEVAGKWYAHDVHICDDVRPDLSLNYSKKPNYSFKILDYFSRFEDQQTRDQLFDVYTSLIGVVTSCSDLDFVRSDVKYTYLQTLADLKRVHAQHQRPQNFGLAAINFYNSKSKSYNVCVTSFFDAMDEDQRAVILLHEIIYVFLEKHSDSAVSPDDVRSLVLKTLGIKR